MNAPVTFIVLSWLLSPVVAFITANWVFTYRGQQALHARISNHGQRLGDYKLAVAEKYVSIEHLKEVETRRVKAMDALSKDMKELTNAVNILAHKKDVD